MPSIWKNAAITSPEWIGGRIGVRCPGCGEYSTNKITSDEIQQLGADSSPRIGELVYTITVTDQPLYITKSKRLGMIVFEREAPGDLTSREKKYRKRTKSIVHIVCIKSVSEAEDDSNDSK